MSERLAPDGDNLDLRRLTRGLARSGRWIVALTGLGLLGGVGYGIAQPNRYASEGKIEVRLGARERRTPESTLVSPNGNPTPTPGIGDEIELLYNPEVYRRVAREVGVERLLAPYDPTLTDGPDTPLPLRWFHRAQKWWSGRQAAELSPEEGLRAAAAVADEAIRISALQGTSYLLVQASATTPELARLLTRAYVSIARQWHREVYASASELTFVSDQLTRFEQESRAAESGLGQHREQCGFYDLESQKELFARSLEEHDARIRESTIRLFEIEDELTFVGTELELTPPIIEKLIPPSVQVNPEYQTALNQLQKLSNERAGLGSEYTTESEVYRRRTAQIQGEIERVEARLAELPGFVEFGSATREKSPNPRFQELGIRQNELRQEKATRTKTLELWKRSREEQESRLRAALLCEPMHRDLERVVERSSTRVQELTAALERAQALALLDRQDDLDSLRIAQEATLPSEKAGPDRLRFLLLGLFGGLAAGMFAAALRFLLDARVHDAETLRAELELEVIGVVPEARAWRRAGAKARAHGGARK